jgi:hypothetical protein
MVNFETLACRMNAKPEIQMKTAALILACALAFAAQPALAQGVDNSAYAALLDKHLENGLVDYAGLKAEEYKLDAYLDLMSNVDVDSLDRDSRLAFWINAYNAWTLKLVLRDYPDVESIKDYGGFFTSPWEIDLVEAAGDLYTLDEVEHEIIRKRFDEPRIHFAVNCASISCPPLRAEPYNGSELNAQLEEQTREFLNDPENTYFEDATLNVSRIFKWYAEDFVPPGVPEFVTRYARGSLRAELEAAEGEIEVEYLDYDWSLNDAEGR